MNATPTPPPDGIDEPISRARETATTAADQAIQKWRSVRSACFRIFWILMGLVILSAAASKVLTARGGTADGLAIAMKSCSSAPDSSCSRSRHMRRFGLSKRNKHAT